MGMIDYRSDNTGRAAPEILEALIRANHGTALGYGGDDYTAALQQRFSELFETAVRVFPVATGTAANSPGQIHRGKPSVVSLTQATDLGAVYTLDEIRAVAEVAKARGLKLHMDGARFANALARLGCSPAAASWRCGIDIMSFGATKNGGALSDAIVVFAPDIADVVAVQLRRAGQVWSKMRFASAQLIAYVENGLWLDMARASNRIAARIAAALLDIPAARILAPVEANEIFLELPDGTMDALER